LTELTFQVAIRTVLTVLLRRSRIAADAIPPFPQAGRAYAHGRLVGPGDTAVSGRARLDAIVDWLQAVAHADVVDAGLEGVVLWVIRRAALRIDRFPRLGERVELTTACSALGARWAERRTRVTGDRGARVEAVALWVAIDPATLRPARVDHLAGVYGESAGDRRVRTGLTHPAPPPDAAARPWPVRRADLDVGGHVNNAAYWQALEEELADVDAPLYAEIEHRAPGGPGEAAVLSAGDRRWVVAGDGTVCASFLVQS
jgi:acyl-ACP thioesterase